MTPKNDKLLEARQRANEVRKEHERKERRRRVLIQVSIIVGALVVVGGIAGAVIAANQAATVVNVPEASTEVTVNGAGGVPFEVGGTSVTVGDPDAPIALSLWEDFSCPHCQDYEALIGDTFNDLISKGEISLEVHSIRFVSNYGANAGSAATCVAEHAPDKWLDVRAGLFEIHGAETDLWTDDDFATYLSDEQGITDDATLSCVRDGKYARWILSNTIAAQDAGVEGTPTLFVNGDKSELLMPEELTEIASQASAQG
ncbi:protein-disulfide isomerase [Microbacteriaceae bacterium SG_E_30_P1]|uniref:Protein-disulfide isomerase n=1 Tax=Antiquaquibacter oligotrophicus TaxID=2880260 RepID=A0ABT6KPJ4_9MICO|nr:thioredoxin domain-containing protein [Antiquaquibacter oligotrophicus]MDH6181104.1 protein-disulfide isomerase [Antiquaquibacter oligotrophicus]UDF13198.1 DsbA family protein [Antiquaquibacter oligotrophicus]